jgi:hypothetical protein
MRPNAKYERRRQPLKGTFRSQCSVRTYNSPLEWRLASTKDVHPSLRPLSIASMSIRLDAGTTVPAEGPQATPE